MRNKFKINESTFISTKFKMFMLKGNVYDTSQLLKQNTLQKLTNAYLFTVKTTIDAIHHSLC